MTVRFSALAVTALTAAGCGLFTSLDGFSDPGPPDGGAEAAAGTRSPTDGATPGAPVECVCPKGTLDVNGVCVVTTPPGGNACAAPIVVPACALAYEAELCADHSAFAYASSCGGKPRPSVFFTLGPLPGVLPDGSDRRWVARSQNTDVLARTNAACSQAVEPCAEGSAPRGELSAGGATVAFGKTVDSGCQTVRIDLAPN